MKKLMSMCLCFLLLATGCTKEEMVMNIDTDLIELNVLEELSDEEILKHVRCGSEACPLGMKVDIRRNQLNTSKAGEYIIDVLYEGSGFPIKIKVVDREKPSMTLYPFSIDQEETIVWNQAMIDRIGLKMSDNATSYQYLLDHLEVIGLDPLNASMQKVTFRTHDEAGNKTEIQVEVNVMEKIVFVPPVIVPPVVEPEPEPDEEIPPVTDSDTEGEESPEDETEGETGPDEEVDESGNEEKTDEEKPDEVDDSKDETDEEEVVEEESKADIRVTTAALVSDILKTSENIEIVYFSQTWCSHCQAFIKTLDSYLNERADLYIHQVVLDLEEKTIIKEIDETGKEVSKSVYKDFEALKEKYRLDFVGTPSLYVFENNQCIGSLIGNESYEALKAFLDPYTNK